MVAYIHTGENHGRLKNDNFAEPKTKSGLDNDDHHQTVQSIDKL